MAVQPLDMRAGTEAALARVVLVFGAARPHHAYLFYRDFPQDQAMWVLFFMLTRFSWLSDGCAMKSASAAAVIFLSSTTLTKYLRCRMSIGLIRDRRHAARMKGPHSGAAGGQGLCVQSAIQVILQRC